MSYSAKFASSFYGPFRFVLHASFPCQHGNVARLTTIAVAGMLPNLPLHLEIADATSFHQGL